MINGNLHLNMVRGAQILLQVNRSVTERRLRLLHADREVLAQLGVVLRHAHPASATTSRRLQDDRVANLLRSGERRRLVRHDAVGARDRGEPVLGEEGARRRFGVELLKDWRGWPNEGELVRRNRLREGGVLGEEAVAGVNGVAAGGERRRDDCGCGEVARLCVGRPNADRLISNEHRARIGIRFAVCNNRLNAELPACAQNAQRNLSTICNQHALDHFWTSPIDSRMKISWPYSTGSPVAARRVTTMPL